MINDPVLVNDWHPVATVAQLEAQNIVAARLLDEDIVLWRVNGETLAWQDLCIHRGTRLSLGKIVEDDKLICPYHGWTYNRRAAVSTSRPTPANSAGQRQWPKAIKSRAVRPGLGVAGAAGAPISPFSPNGPTPVFAKCCAGRTGKSRPAGRALSRISSTLPIFLLSTRAFWAIRAIPKLRSTKPRLARTGFNRAGLLFTSPIPSATRGDGLLQLQCLPPADRPFSQRVGAASRYAICSS